MILRSHIEAFEIKINNLLLMRMRSNRLKHIYYLFFDWNYSSLTWTIVSLALNDNIAHPCLEYANAIRSTLSQILFEIGFESLFNQLFWSNVLESDWIIMTKLIISCPIYIEKVNLYQKSIKFDQKWSKMTLSLINFDIFN